MSKDLKGKLFLIVGPSGVGKSTLIGLLKENHPDFIAPITATTRAPRPTERDGVHYHFLSKEEFLRRVGVGDFLEYARVHGDEYYGVLRDSVEGPLREGRVLVREVDIQGARTIHEKFGGRHLVSIFLLPPSRGVLTERIRKRAPISDEELGKRFESLDREVAQAGVCDFQIQFGDEETIEECFQKLEGVILESLDEA